MFDVEVVPMMYIAAGVFFVVELFDTDAIQELMYSILKCLQLSLKYLLLLSDGLW